MLACVVLGGACGRSDSGGPVAGLEIESGAGGVTWSVHAGVITASNGVVTLRWDATSGALVGVDSVLTGTQFLGGGGRGGFAIALDGVTDDVFAARATLGPLAESATTLASFDATPIAAGGMTFDLGFAKVGPATVVQHVTLAPADPVAHFTTDVTIDPGARATVVAIASPAILGVATQPGEKLVWPWHEGTILEAPGATYQWMQYPSPASMQWMELYTAHEGLYAAALDATGGYKELRFGDDDGGGPRQMAFAFYPFATGAAPYTTPPVDVGVAPEGGWYWGADRYRAFLDAAGMKRALPPIVRAMPGWHKGYDRYPQVPPGLTTRPPDIDYCALPTANMPADYTAKTGLSLLLMYGWYFDGQDSNFPDFDFLAKAAPASCENGADLAAALGTLAARPIPNRVMFYINAHIADDASDWMQDASNAASAAMKPDGSRYAEHYGDWPTRSFHAMCPSVKRWQDQLDAVAMRMRNLAPPGAGAVGVYWDQLEEMPSALCFDRTHGHATPATAYPAGYKAFLTRVGGDFGLGGTDTEFVFAAEGANDFYSQFIDVAGGMPGRLMGYTFPVQEGGGCDQVIGPCGAAPITHAPEVGRYTMFARFLGLPDVGAGDHDADAYARAFLMADPLRTNPITNAQAPYATTNPNVFPRLPAIYGAEPSIYEDGRFMDANGLTLSVDASSARGTLIVGANGDRVGVQLWNETAADLDVAVTIDLAHLGLAATPAATLADLDGKPAPALSAAPDHASFTAHLAAHDVAAIRLSL